MIILHVGYFSCTITKRGKSNIVEDPPFKTAKVGLAQKGFKVTRTPFGWFNTLEVKANGRPLSRVARRFELKGVI